ncbi:MAG: GumC family protein, partial [Limisphaerales bacterium]
MMEGEVFILASQEVAQQLVESVGADRILGPDNKATNATLEATIQIRESLLVIPAKRSSVITVAYSHPDPAIAQQVLSALDTVYKNRHRQVHDKGMTFEELGRQKDDAKNKLDQLQSQLNLLKSQLGIASLPEAKTAVSLRLEALESERDAAERELEAQKARLAQLEKGLAVSSSVIANTNEPLPEVSATMMASYRNLMGRLESLRNEESRLLGIWTPESELVKNVQRQIEQLDAQKNSMEMENPRLVGVVAPTSSTTGPIGPDLNVERATLMGLEASLRRVEDQISQQRNRLNELASREAEILNLERERAIQDTNLTYLVREMSRKDYDRNLGNTTAKNIELIDGPTLPSRNLTEVLMKPMAACAFGGLAIGLALAFLIELVLDLRVKRPSEVEGKLGLPLMLTVPRVKGMGKFKLDMNKALPAPKKDTANESPVPILPSLMGEVKEGKAASGKRQA